MATSPEENLLKTLPVQRRDVLKLGGAGLTSMAAMPWLSAAEATSAKSGAVTEAARDVPVAGEADVIVCGADRQAWRRRTRRPAKVRARCCANCTGVWAAYKVEHPASGEEVWFIPAATPKPTALEKSWEPGPIAKSRFTEAERKQIDGENK